MPAGNQVYSTEVQRWCPDRECFAATQDQRPTGQADVLKVCIGLHAAHSIISACLLGMDLRPQHDFTLSSQCRCCCLKSLLEGARCDEQLIDSIYVPLYVPGSK